MTARRPAAGLPAASAGRPHRPARRALLAWGALLALLACSEPDVTPLEPEPPAPPPEEPAPHDAVTAFVDVTVLPMDGRGALSAQTVVVEGELVTAMGPATSAQIPEGAEVVDGAGRWLMPGLIDTHSHVGTNYAEFTNRVPPPGPLQEMAEGQFLLYLANGVTTVLGNGDFVEPMGRWARELRAGDYPGPTLYAALWVRGGVSTPDGGPPSLAPATPGEARVHVRTARSRGYDFVKTYNWPSSDVLDAVYAAADDIGMAVLGHQPQTQSLERALDGIDMITHSEAFYWKWFGYQPVEARVAPLIDAVVGHDTWITATLDVTATAAQVWGGDREGIAAFWARPENRYMHWTERALHEESIEGPRWNPPGSRPGGFDARNAFVRDYTRRMYEAGVRLLAGTDSPTVFGVAGFSMLRELDALASIGLTNEQVLEIATRNAGDFFAQTLPDEARVGTVAVGHRADLLLLEADPGEDLANLTRRVAVMARGRLYREEDLQTGLAELADRYAGGVAR